MGETMGIVERVKQAIIASRDLPEGCQINDAIFERDARAAIDAIRNHSFGDTIVLVNGTDPVATLKGDLPGTILRALIDLAMAEGPALASPEEGRDP